MNCVVLTGTSASNLETVINTWLAANDNSGTSVTINYVSVTEGSVGASLMKAVIFYTANTTRAEI